jgi:hypothetical protein
VAGPVAIGAVLIVAFFALGYGTRRYWVGGLPLALPVFIFVASLAGDDAECREFCGAEWAAIYALAGLVAALVLGAAVALGVRLRTRAS